jgi:hypothetical protein
VKLRREGGRDAGLLLELRHALQQIADERGAVVVERGDAAIEHPHPLLEGELKLARLPAHGAPRA